MDTLRRALKKMLPRGLVARLRPPYHYLLAYGSALMYGFPSRHLTVIGVTGTKGKTSTVEMIAAILTKAGHAVALSDSRRVAIREASEEHRERNSMPGRGQLERFLRRAVAAGCDYAVIEMTSEGAVQYRHIGIDMRALVFTNLSPEHIESHGSYENYVAAKLSLAHALEGRGSGARAIVVNADDAEAERFLSTKVGTKLTYRLDDARPFSTRAEGSAIEWRGIPIPLNVPGEFNIMNALGAATLCDYLGVPHAVIAHALSSFAGISGRTERVEAGQPFTLLIDYAHTADSLERVYRLYDNRPIIAVLGGTGGGRDKAKRPVMGAVADRYCSQIILTTEDPYDESPRTIAEEIAQGIVHHPYTYIEDRRLAIREALRRATPDSVVILTGKGSETAIMGPHDTTLPWNEARVAREEVKRLLS